MHNTINLVASLYFFNDNSTTRKSSRFSELDNMFLVTIDKKAQIMLYLCINSNSLNDFYTQIA